MAYIFFGYQQNLFFFQKESFGFFITWNSKKNAHKLAKIKNFTLYPHRGLNRRKEKHQQKIRFVLVFGRHYHQQNLFCFFKKNLRLALPEIQKCPQVAK